VNDSSCRLLLFFWQLFSLPNVAAAAAVDDDVVILDGVVVVAALRLTVKLWGLRGGAIVAAGLCMTRVRNPDMDDWGKLVKMMKFFKHTAANELTLRSDGTHTAQFHVEAAFAVHPDFWSDTGATFTLGEGVISLVSRKQEMNTRSLTEAENVAAD
jgi:hypothetical protein